MQPQPRIIKPVDQQRKPVMILPTREYWMAQRRALQAQIAAIEELLGIHRQQCRCQVDNK